MTREATLEALRGFWRLDRRTRREALRLARRGRAHSDPAVRRAAWHWACAVLPVGAPEPGGWRNHARAAGFFGVLALDLVSGCPSATDDPPTPGWWQRRQARRLLRVGPPV